VQTDARTGSSTRWQCLLKVLRFVRGRLVKLVAIDFETANYEPGSACAVAVAVGMQAGTCRRFRSCARCVWCVMHGGSTREIAQCVPQLRIPLNHHDALSDATACAKIAIAAMKKCHSVHVAAA
jgi:hypothetical protein